MNWGRWGKKVNKSEGSNGLEMEWGRMLNKSEGK